MAEDMQQHVHQVEPTGRGIDPLAAAQLHLMSHLPFCLFSKPSLQAAVLQRTVHPRREEMQLHARLPHHRKVHVVKPHLHILLEHTPVALDETFPAALNPDVDVAAHTPFRPLVEGSHALSFQDA